MTRKKTDEQFKQEMKLKHPNILITSKYQGASKKVDCECLIDGHKWSPQATSLQQNHGCPMCSGTIKKTHEQFVEEMKIKHPNIKILGRYINDRTPIDCECLIDGHKWSAKPNNLLQGKGCRQCYVRNSRGENNPNWNPNKTDEEREDDRSYLEYKEWRTSVYEKDNYTCQCCGSNKSGTFNAHHKDGYNWCIERRLDITNGVTLCEDCHNEFHHIYGYGYNTEQQWEEFMNNNNNNNNRDVI